MKITDIKQQVKTQGRYSIFVDGKFAFGLGDAVLMTSGLRIGQELDQPQLDALKDTARTDKAYNRALHLIARRPRSEWEVRDYLRRKEYEPELIDALIRRLYDSKWLDDVEFAKRWVENRRLLKATSRRRLSQELKMKRVADDVVRAVLESDETSDIEVLKQVVVRKRTQTRYQDDQKLMAYLMRQGYNYHDIKTAMDGAGS